MNNQLRKCELITKLTKIHYIVKQCLDTNTKILRKYVDIPDSLSDLQNNQLKNALDLINLNSKDKVEHGDIEEIEDIKEVMIDLAASMKEYL